MGQDKRKGEKMEKIMVSKKHYNRLFKLIHRLQRELLARKMTLEEIYEIRDEVFERYEKV